MGPEPFDPVIDPPFFDLDLRLAEPRLRFPLSSTTARTAEPTPSAPGVPPGRPLLGQGQGDTRRSAFFRPKRFGTRLG